MKAAASVFEDVSALRKQGNEPAALERLRAALRASALAAEEVDRAGRVLAKVRQPRPRDVRVRLLGQCTTAWLANVLEAEAYGRGVELSVSQGEFDNVLQELTALDPQQSPCDVLILLPWSERFLRNTEREGSARIADELAFWRDAWELARARGISKIVQVGYDWVVPGALGHHLGGREGGDIELVRQLNAALRQALPRGAYFADLEQVSGVLGRLRFYDPRQYHWTKQPFSQEGVWFLAQQLFAGVRASMTGPKKVLVVDLDNTLWGGVVGELGPQGVRFGDGPDGEAFRSFQEHLKTLSKRGVLLAVASKNNLEDARAAFDERAMELTNRDFAAFEACWEPKAQMLRRIADALNLGLDSFVFFDDNPAEREHIRQALPEVEVVDVPLEAAEYTRALQSGAWFETVALTAEDRVRGDQYAVERLRNEARTSVKSLDEYLTSLEMHAQVQRLGDTDLARVVQLLGKTNQFNLTTRRHSEEQVQRMLAVPGHVCLTVRMRDRFGDYGLVGCVLAVPHADADVPSLRVDTWLMSCRVIGRTLEQRMLLELASRASVLGYRQLLGEYIPTQKNQLVAALYPDLGFVACSPSTDSRRLFQLELPHANPPRTFVAVEKAVPR